MKNFIVVYRRMLCICAIFSITVATGATQAAGLLTPVNSSLPALEIKKHEVLTIVQDGYAITKVEQLFHNPHQRDLDALYSFPIPKKAAVSELTVWIDGSPVTGEVLEKEKARKIHEEEKAAGRETGLVEQKGYQRFEVSVSPVRAGQDIKIRLQYIQPTDIDTGIGRYVYPLEEGGVDDEKLAFWTANNKVTERFRFELVLRSTYPVEVIRAPNVSDAVITQSSDKEWRLVIDRTGSNNTSDSVLDESAPAGSVQVSNNSEQSKSLQRVIEQSQSTAGTHHASRLDSDIVVYWRHAQNLPGSLDLVAYRKPGSAKGTFMMVLTPGDDLKQIDQGRDWLFVLDISGSMSDKYSMLAEGVKRAFRKMDVGDRFRIVLFNNKARELTNGWTEINPEAVESYSKKITSIIPGNGTNLFAGLKKGLSNIESGRTSGMILVTDGVANVGEITTRKMVELLKRYDIRVFTFVMGNGANRPLLEAISRETSGFALNISNNDDIVGKLLEATGKVNHQAMHGVNVKFNGVRTSDVTPKTIGSIYRGEQVVVFGHYWEPGEIKVNLNTSISGNDKTYSTRFDLPGVDEGNPEIERLWAFSSIEDLQNRADLYGESDDVTKAIVDLGVDHGIVTEQTSMVVMREEQFQARGISRKNKQRLQREHVAQQQRISQPVKQRRVDNSKSEPMFKSKRSTHSGGGVGISSFDYLWFIVLMPLMLSLLINRRRA